jgi:hypothetical protein
MSVRHSTCTLAGPGSSARRGASLDSRQPLPHEGLRLGMSTVSLYLSMAGLAFRRPRMIPDMVRAAWAFRALAWYRRPPFLPLPPRTYLRWRLETAYGDPDAVPSPDEVERYLAWGAELRRAMKRRPGG